MPAVLPLLMTATDFFLVQGTTVPGPVQLGSVQLLLAPREALRLPPGEPPGGLSGRKSLLALSHPFTVKNDPP